MFWQDKAVDVSQDNTEIGQSSVSVSVSEAENVDSSAQAFRAQSALLDQKSWQLQTVKLHNFRTYASLALIVSPGLNVLIGKNGAGKTNFLEALSLFSQGRGLRRCEIAECARNSGDRSGGGETGDGSWSAALTLKKVENFSARFEGHKRNQVFGLEVGGQPEHKYPTSPEMAHQIAHLGTGFLPRTDNREGKSDFVRHYRFNQTSVGSVRVFADYVRVLWQTPSMDGLFMASPSERRKFLDRLVLALDPNHGVRVNRLEQALRARNKLLADMPQLSTRTYSSWLNACEQELAGLAVAVASARVLLVQQLQGACDQQGASLAGSGFDTRKQSEGHESATHFPAVDLRLEGLLETWLCEDQALRVEERYLAHLHDNRAKDQQAGRTREGPHSSDLMVYFRDKGILAAQASTGEQKALLTGIVVAHAHLVRDVSGIPPILLLDEIAAHFDAERRASLFALLAQLGGTVLMTGADPHQFEDSYTPINQFLVSPGQIDPR